MCVARLELDTSIGRRASRRISNSSRPASSWHAVSLVPGRVAKPSRKPYASHTLPATATPSTPRGMRARDEPASEATQGGAMLFR